ncbi:EAL domain-containing protein [Undibacterium sp. Di24W]|uniref:EAL domain-containing protein n=1 Tax=Undibacterium sp. Di24W TaxID=3413033 RepID=UPI003BF22275
MSIDEKFPFLEEPNSSIIPDEGRWRVLVVDDDEDVHQTSILALKDLIIEDRLIEFVHAYSAAEARSYLTQNTDVAVVLLDVVMETEDAGLQLVKYIREVLKNRSVRIILRTGQPGYAPEIETIREFDINDYKTKAELTRARLFTSMTAAIRSYWQIYQLEASRNGLEQIVKASGEFSRPQGLQLLAQGILSQLCALLGVGHEGLVCAAKIGEGHEVLVVAAAGTYAPWIGKPLEFFPDNEVRKELVEVLSRREHQIGPFTCLYFSSHDENAIAAFVRVDKPIRDMDRNLLEVFCSNISIAFDNAGLYQKISALAYVDALLNLPNRNGLLHLISNTNCDNYCLALVDVDGFSDLNSVLDQHFGDSVLIAIATRLRESFPSNVEVARVGSDVFGLLGPREQVTPNHIAQIFKEPFNVGDEHVRLSATSGMVYLEHKNTTGAQLLRDAATALKQGKAFARGKTLFFEEKYANEANERMFLLSRLRHALSAERLFVVYQPFFDLNSGKIVGAEALLRWRNEEGEFVPPDRFIPIAEQSGLIVPIGDWVLSTALAFTRRLLTLSGEHFRIAINISQIQFREPNFVDDLVATIERHGLNPKNVEIELTESVAVDDIQQITQKLLAIRSKEISIAIDDFGTGFSSLNVMRRLPVNRLKIDRAFVSGDACQGEDYGIAEMVHSLASHLGLHTIAEGIETIEQHEKMKAIGIREGQGYLFSKPLPEGEFESFFLKTMRA